MIETQAQVVASGPGFVRIEAERRSACGQCSAHAGCGVSALASVFGARRQRLRLPDPLGLRAGDAVRIGIPERELLVAALVAYLLPLLTMLFAALLAAGPGAGQGARAVAALAGLAAGLVLARRRMRGYQAGGRGLPVILGRPAGTDCTTNITGERHE